MKTGEIMRPEMEVTQEIVIQNSRFIGILIPFEGVLKAHLDRIKKTYPRATHYCYAFTYQKEQGMHDDGEPNKTAGFPILKKLEKYHLQNTLLIVVRYFGGIKLGTGGLMRAYQKTAEETILKAHLLPIKEGYKVQVEVTYDNLKQLEYLLKEEQIIDKKFQEKVLVTAYITKEKKTELENFTSILSLEDILF